MMGQIILEVVGGMFLLLGLASIVGGSIFSVRIKKKMSRWTGHTTGTVVRISEDNSSISDGPTVTTYAPVVEYWVNGQKYEKCNKMYHAPCKYSLGQSVTLRYDPDRPENMEIEGDTVSNVGVGLIIVGVFLSMMGATMLCYVIK